MDVVEFKNVDKSFNEDKFIVKVKNIFIKLFTNIMTDKLDEVDHFISEQVYDYAQKIIDDAKKKDAIQIYDELNVSNCVIKNINISDNKYEAIIFLEARYMDYLINSKDRSYLSGNNRSRIQKNYLLTFKKKFSTIDEDIIHKCPTCGASLDINNSGKCDYCGSIYDQENHDWVLEKIEEL